MASTARLDELKKKFDENPRRYFAPLANEHRKSGDLDQAISLCRAHLPLQPAHISGHIVLAQALFEAGTIDESRDIFLAALGLDPENLIALRYLGDIAREASDVDTARSWYQRVLEVDPRNDEIVQLVRELDMPRPAVEAELDIVADAPLEIETVSTVPSPQSTAINDARFEPLSMEEFNVGGDAPTADAGRQQTEDVAEPAVAEDSFDVHAAWSTESPSLDQAMLDTSEIDPFDLHPSASAESLFVAETDPAAADFLTELSGINAPDDGSDSASPYAMEVWTESTTEEVTAASTPAAGESDSFEEGLPLVTASAAPSVHAAAEEVFVSEAIAAHEEPAQESIPAEAHESVAMADPNAEALALFADSQTAEWEPPTADVASTPPSSVADTLGLEVMEFVPPSSEAAPSSILEAPSDTDPLLGRTPDLEFAEQESAPPVFVTETMAELYLQQGFRNEALEVYRELLARNPADASLRDRIEKIESGSMSSLGMATLSEEVVESAMKRQTGRPARSVRSLFASLASRRAPVAPSQPHVAESYEAAVESPITDYAPASEAGAAAESPMITEAPADGPTVSASERIAPLMSAAQSLASFDPFADTPEMIASAPESHAPSLMHDPWADVTPIQAQSVAPEPSLGVPHAIDPVASIDSAPQRRTLEDLFPNAPVTARTEAAAQTFATAFGRDEPQGRPTRAANNELSLDHVFRGSADNTAAPDGGFSFDQFFSDARPAGGDVAAPTMSAPDIGGRSAGPGGDAHDIEQFTAWLEGLKKK